MELRVSNSEWYGIDPETSPFPPPDRLEYSNIGRLFIDQAEQADSKCFALFRDPADRQWATMSWREACGAVLNLTQFLVSRCNFLPGDRAAIAAGPRCEALLADAAALCSGGAAAMLDPGVTAEDFAALLARLQPKVIVLEGKGQEHLLGSGLTLHQTKTGCGILLIDPPSRDCAAAAALFSDAAPWRCESWKTVLQELKDKTAAIPGSAPAAIHYAAPHQGTAAGAEEIVQTHANHVAMLDALYLSGLLGTTENLFLTLPFSCSFSRICAWAAIGMGGSIIFPTRSGGAGEPQMKESESLAGDFRQSHPALLVASRETVQTLGRRCSRPDSRLFRWAAQWKAGSRPENAGPAGIGYLLKEELARAVFDKVRRRTFGSRLSAVLCEGPDLEQDAGSLYQAMGIPVLTGLWLPEATGALSFNTTHSYRAGSVGRLFDGMAAEVDPASFQLSFSGRAAAKSAADDAVRTGIRAGFDEDGYLFITARERRQP